MIVILMKVIMMNMIAVVIRSGELRMIMVNVEENYSESWW